MNTSRITNCPVCGKPRRLPSGHLPGDVRGHHALGVVNLLATRSRCPVASRSASGASGAAGRRGGFGLVAATALLLTAGAAQAATGWVGSSVFGRE